MRARVDREQDRVALRKRHHRDAGLHPWPLLGQNEFAALKILARLRQQHRGLQREDMLAVKILVQAIIVARAIAEQQWSRALLPGSVATAEKVGMVGGKAGANLHALVPAVGD